MAEWEPRRNPALGPRATQRVPKLSAMCLALLVEHIHNVETLWGMPSVIKVCTHPSRLPPGTSGSANEVLCRFCSRSATLRWIGRQAACTSQCACLGTQLGMVSPQVQLATAVASARRMTPEAALLFTEGTPDDVVLSECTQLDPAALSAALSMCASPRRALSQHPGLDRHGSRRMRPATPPLHTTHCMLVPAHAVATALLRAAWTGWSGWSCAFAGAALAGARQRRWQSAAHSVV